MYPVRSLARQVRLGESHRDLGEATSNGMYLSIIIPAYNEEKRIGSTLKSIDEYLRWQNYEYEIIVVNNESSDKTASLVESLKLEIKNLKLMNTRGNGKGYAVKQGMLQARGELRVFTDADNSTSIDHLDKFIPYIDEGYDVVIGSIAVPGYKIASGSEPAWRRIAGKLGNLFIQIMAVPGIKDTQRGFKLVTAKAANNIFPKLTIPGWGFDIEMLVLAKKFGYKVKELPIDWENDPNSKVGLKAYFQVLLETVIIRWNLIKGEYDKK